MRFYRYIGIDYSGAETANWRKPGLQVYMATLGALPQKVTTPAAPPGQKWNWTREEIAKWLIELAKTAERFIAGIDHAFSFPATYLNRFKLQTWDEFLDDFCKYWRTAKPNVYVEDFRKRNPRVGKSDEFRLTERWTSSAKSVFKFDVQGSVAKSTHAGIPWLKHIRDSADKAVHFWPFDGWDLPEGKHVLVEVYPSIFRNRYTREGRTGDEHDAYAVARWLSETDARGFLDRYLSPSLTDDEKRLAEREGWILGIA